MFRAFQLLLEKSLKKRLKLSTGQQENEILKKILESSRRNNVYNGIEFLDDVDYLTIVSNILNVKRIPNEICAEFENEIYAMSTLIFELKIEDLYLMSINLLLRHLRIILSKDNIVINQMTTNQDDELKVGVWFKHLLALIFTTNDEKIRALLITAFELYTGILSDLHYRTMPFWPDVKSAIFDQCATKLHELRNTTPQWYKIWTILAQIVSVEIIKSASIINKFLSIVEIGFRGDDLRIRAQAYLCWRSLIEIFGRDNELNVSKRIRLVCIPLKPARPKSQDIAINKFKAWWCLVTKLNQNVLEHLSTILLPFLEFCLHFCKIVYAANTSSEKYGNLCICTVFGSKSGGFVTVSGAGQTGG